MTETVFEKQGKALAEIAAAEICPRPYRALITTPWIVVSTSSLPTGLSTRHSGRARETPRDPTFTIWEIVNGIYPPFGLCSKA